MRTNLLNDLSNVLKKGASLNLLPKMDRECIGNDSRMDRQGLGKFFRYAAMITLLLTLACGNVWGTDVSATAFTASQSGSVYTISAKSGSGSLSGVTVTCNQGVTSNLVQFKKSGYLQFSVASGSVITYIKLTYSASDKAPKSTSDITEESSLGSITTVISNPYTTTWTGSAQTVKLLNSSSGQDTRISQIDITYGSSSRTFRSGEVIYFKDAWKTAGNASTWKVDKINSVDGSLCAYFWNDTENGWYKCYGSDNVSGNWNADNTVYRITVPGEGKVFTKVLFTRGTNDPYNVDKWSGVSDQTHDQMPSVGQNLFTVNNTKTDGKYNGTWSKYGYPAALVGDFNNWDPSANVFPNSGTSSVNLDNLSASTAYKFKVLQGETYWGLNSGSITSTTTPWWLFYSGQGDCTVTTTTTGRYTFAWNTTTQYLGVYYPGGVFTKNKYIYFDVTSETYWNANAFKAQFYFKYVDSGSDLDDQPVECSTPLENYVYYAVVPNSDYAGQIQMNRYYNGGVDGISNVCYAYSRGDDKKNCMTHESGKENYKDSWTPQWKTYCPPMSSATLSDNSTTVIAGTSGNGSAGNPYIVPTSGTIQVQAAATSAVPDPAMTKMFDFKVDNTSQQNSTATTYSKGSLSNNTVYQISVDAYNTYNETNGTKKTPDMLFYKALNQYSVTIEKTGVTKSSGAEGSNAVIHTYADYMAVFAASTGYNLPASVTVTRGGSDITANCAWVQGTGMLTIPAAQITGNITITVTGVAKTTAITLDKNNSDPGSTSGSVTATYGSKDVSSLVHATRTGYTQNGYETSDHTLILKSDGTFDGTHSGYTDSKTWVNESANVTLYARWTANKFDVTHTLSHVTRSSGGEAGSDKATYGTAYSVTFAASSGYTLPDAVTVTVGGSDVTANCTWDQGTGELTIPAAYVTGNIVITVTGEAAVTYTVTYDAQGGSVTPTSETVSTATLPTPTKSGYTFQGWYTSGGAHISGTYNPTADITLHALWRADCVGGGGGGGTLFSQNFNSATEVAYENRTDASLLINKNSSNNIVGTTAASQFTSIAAAKKDKTGIAINTTSGGNSVNASGFFQTYYDNTSGYWSVTKTTDFATTAPTAIKMSMDLYFDTKSSSGSCELVNFAIGDGFSDGLMSTSAQSSSNVHSGWGIAQNSKKICGYNANGTILYNTALSESTWYSITWVINNTGEDLTYDDPDGSGTTTLANDKFDIWLKTQAQTATNYTKVVTAAATTTSKALQELYFGHISGKKNEFRIDNIVVADLTPSSGTCYYVTYNGNGATGGFTKDETAYALNANPTVASNSFTKTGYTFTGWNTAPGGGGTAYAAGGTISNISADVTLYAQWTADAATYDLTWNTNGGSDLVCSGTCTSGDLAYGATIVAPTDPTKSNYTFDGWNTANDGSGSAAAATMPAEDVTYYAAWKQTVTLNTGSQGSEANKTPYVYLNGAELSDDAVHSAAGYTLQGYYSASSGGVKVLKADGTFASANVTDYITSSKWSRTGAAPTLYAQWRAAGGASCNTIDHVTGFPDNGTTGKTVGNLKVTYAGDKVKTDSRTIYSEKTERPTIKIGGSGTEQYVQGYLAGNEISSLELGVSEGSYYAVAFSASSTFSDATVLSWSAVNSQYTSNSTSATSDTLTTITVPSGAKYFRIYRKASFNSIELGSGSSVYVWHIKACTAGSSTHTISYNNGGGSGTMTSDASIADDGSKAIKTNTFTAPSNFAFAGWVADVDVTISGNTVTAGTLIANGATITNITTDIALTAKWSQTITLDKNSSNHGTGDNGSATVYYNATELASITHTTPASGYKLEGYYTTASGEGTKVLNSDGSFASTSVTGYITDGKWTQNSSSTPKLYARYELAGGIVTNTLKVGANKWGSSISTSEPTLITSLNALAAVGGLTIENANGTTASGTALTCKIEASGATSKTDSKYLQLSFTIATGYKLNVTGIGMTVRSVSKDGKYHIELAGTTGSLTPDDETVGSGSIAAIFDDTYNQDFTGTVTLKLWAYGKDGSNLMSEYRLANPITIYGTLIETCTMPSYSSVTYTKTEYTVSETSSAITVTSPSDVTSYQWKYNSTGDRTSGTNADAVGTGATTASFTPSTSVAHEKRYYWCELTNACGTIKTEAVGVTVSTSKSTATVTWSNPGTVNYGGGGYTLRATVDQSAWDGTASDLTITAPAGINIYGVTSGTDGSSKKYVEVTFDVQTSFDRSTYSSNIPFTLSAAATTDYNAISNEHNVAYVACSGGGGEGSAFIEVTSGVTTAKSGMSNYWEAAGVGRLNKAYNQSMGSSADAQTIEGHAFSYRTGANNSNWMVNTYIAGVTKIRLYFYASAAIASGKLDISKVLYDTEYFSSQGDRSVVFSNVETSAASYAVADKGWIEFELPEMAANSYCYFATNTGNLYIYGVELFSESVGSGGTLNTHLQWSGGLADKDIVSKSTNDAYFTYSASKITENMNTLGAITYSSSAPSVATVDATGKVSMVAAGSTTIKATLAASGCYKKAEISYTLNVSEPVCSIAAGTLELTSGSETKCEGNEVTLTLTGFESGATLQWKDGDTDVNHNGSTYKIATAGTTSTLTTNQPGTYSVIVHDDTNDCDVRSNRITISNKSTSVSAERIVKSWYVKNGRMTPDIELWSLSEGTHLSSVAFTRSDAGDATAIGLSNSDVYESDGKVYLKGTAPSANSTGSDIAYTLTLTVTDECNNTTTLSASDKQITLYHQKNTDKHVVAFVVTGTEKGGFTEGVPSNQTTEIDLYKAIAAEFDVVATNVYSTDDEQAIKEYYSQFDILCVTDYPDTNTKGAKKQSYVNALGSLIDIRPILTMEAFVAKWSNWAAKGISGTPKSPDPKQYAMDLQCKDHEIFDGTDWSTVGTGDEMMYRVTMVSSTSYPSKPALQGFTFDATMVADGLLPLGQIYNGSTETLQVGIERQNEMAARLMVLGINSVAMERLTDDGQRVVINALKYLMKKNEEDIADCSVSFVGGAEEGSKTDWNNDANWSTGKRPDKTTREVRILAPCVITDGQTITSPTIKIADGGTYDGGTKADGKLTINAGGVLKVKGEVVGVTAPAYSKKKATEASRLELETSASKQSALILKNENGMTRATVNLYSLGRKDGGRYQFQYFAIPFEYVDINPAFYGSNILTYVWREKNGGWERRGYYDGLYAFEGVGITKKDAGAKTYTMTGTLASTEEKEITLTKDADGENIIGNSWTAPIRIASLRTALVDDDNIVDKTVYIYVTGNDTTDGVPGSSHSETATSGQWLAIPINAAGWSTWDGLKVIPAMQAYYIKANAETTMTLNYDSVVRTTPNDSLTVPLKAPRRTMNSIPTTLTRLRVADSKTHTDLYLFEGDEFTEAFDNGWEAKYMSGDGRSAKLCAETEIGQMAVAALPELEGTVLNFAPGQEMTYTFTFTDGASGYYLNDLKLKQSVLISEENSYAFTYEAGDTNRFYISRTAINAPQVTTGMGNTGDGVKAKKILYNDKLYIIVNGHVYSAEGAIVK